MHSRASSLEMVLHSCSLHTPLGDNRTDQRRHRGLAFLSLQPSQHRNATPTLQSRLLASQVRLCVCGSPLPLPLLLLLG